RFSQEPHHEIHVETFFDGVGKPVDLRLAAPAVRRERLPAAPLAKTIEPRATEARGVEDAVDVRPPAPVGDDPVGPALELGKGAASAPERRATHVDLVAFDRLARVDLPPADADRFLRPGEMSDR